MDEKIDAPKVSPPQSIIIQGANTDNVNDTSTFTTFPGAQDDYNKNQVIISVDGKPSLQLFGASLLTFFISVTGFFFGIDYFDIDEEFLCCLMCNGNATGFILLGVYSTQYGKWERNSGAKVSAFASGFIAVVAFIVAVIFVLLWLLYITN